MTITVFMISGFDVGVFLLFIIALVLGIKWIIGIIL